MNSLTCKLYTLSLRLSLVIYRYINALVHDVHNIQKTDAKREISTSRPIVAGHFLLSASLLDLTLEPKSNMQSEREIHMDVTYIVTGVHI